VPDGIAEYLVRLRRNAGQSHARQLAGLRWGMPALGALCGVVVYLAIDLFGGGSARLAKLAGMLTLATVAGVGWGFAALAHAALPGLRQRIRRALLDHGLLQLVLEHEPYDRLPSLRPQTALLHRPLRPIKGGPLAQRLERLMHTYTACCAEAGIAPLPALPSDELPQSGWQRFIRRLPLALAVLGGGVLWGTAFTAALLVSDSPRPGNPVLILVGFGTLALIAFAPLACIREYHSAELVETALRLELAELLLEGSAPPRSEPAATAALAAPSAYRTLEGGE
jgi:hypothetical protein